MRNLIAILAVLAMGVNSMAAITFVATDNTDGTATVAWTSDEGVAGMALEMTVTTGGADLAVTMNDFNVFIDEAFSIVDGGGTLTELPASNPVANADAAGTAAAAGTFVVCGGYLAENNPGLMAGSIVLSASEDTTLDVVADATRGGVVALGGAALAVDPFTVTITADVPCPGDITGDGRVNALDLVQLKAAYFSNPSSANWNPNADLDGSGMVNALDLVILKQNYFNVCQ
jgi:hypothetical protein